MLWRVSNEWQATMRVALKPFDLSHAQFVILAGTVWLEDKSEDINQAALARHAVMDKMMVSDVVRLLEKKQLIRRNKDLHDARSVAVKATAKGVDVLQAAMKAVEHANKDFFSRSDFSQKEIVAMLRSLSNIDM
jgi:DNA-binding MarR family transcriptional regulator